MTRVEQEKLVGNYLRGEMSAAQEQEFFIQVALDSDLRQTLKAFRVVDTAIQKHREAISPNHAESYNRLMAMLSASATEPAAVVGVTSGLMQRGLSFLGARVFSWTSAVIATGALTIGAFLVGPAVYQSDKAPAEVRVQKEKPATVDLSTPASELSQEEHNVQPAETQPSQAITTGAAREDVNEFAGAFPNPTRKQSASGNAAEIAADAQKKSVRRGIAEDPANVDPILDLIQNVGSQKSADFPSASGINIVIHNADEQGKDTIDLNVQMNSSSIGKKPNRDR